MMRKILWSFFAAVCLVSLTAAQTSLNIPRNVLRAYEKGTRSFDGKPGKNYWGNHSDYFIKAELIPQTRTVKGYASITYYNDSPDTLNQYVLRLYQDIYKKGSSRDWQLNPKDITDGVKIDTLIINGSGVSFESKDYRVMRAATNLVVSRFPIKIAPGTSGKIEVEWNFVIPKESRLRMGAYNDSTFYSAYWYPQIAVYDDVDGWDRQEYNGTTEFYNDKNNFDVEITVPGGFIVWATGVVQNTKENLKPEIFERYQKALASDEVVRIITAEDYKNGNVTNAGEKLTWKFKAEGVPDFAFAACAKYLWDGSSVEVDYNTSRRVFADAVYPIGAKFQEEVALFARLSVELLSHEWPAIPFPYPKITVFNGEQHGGGGMETPMMCNNAVYNNRAGQIGVTVHEIAHTYFPFYMGINERKYAWMDEGWASFFTFDLVKRMEPESDELPGFVRVLNNMLGNEGMLPLITPSYSVRTNGYGSMAYQQPAIAYYILRDFLGEELFKKALHDYINNWNGKHPIPYDFFFAFDRVAGENLSWFWQPWFFERGFADLTIEGIEKANSVVVNVKNLGTYPVPVDLKVSYVDGITETFHKPASVWKNGEKVYKHKIDSSKEISKIELIQVLGPDVNMNNNSYEVKKITQ
ncbi:MAG: M1 family metallopeptidase [Ignavibacteriales bacterium]|nr:M1 family metallopeptidase [Ignavibacteriales bacterium]